MSLRHAPCAAPGPVPRQWLESAAKREAERLSPLQALRCAGRTVRGECRASGGRLGRDDLIAQSRPRSVKIVGADHGEKLVGRYPDG